MSIIDEILKRPEFADRPPILLDIGAAGEINPKWREIAPYSICIAFDADDREMGYVERETKGYRELFVYNCIASADSTGQALFFLTHSPQCSSLLEPRYQDLEKWAFCESFHVKEKIRLQAKALPDVLAELNISRIDWFKTDSQGSDLRLFASLGDDMIAHVLAAEFEPGIIDAYYGEDKLWQILAYMENKPFWLSSLTVKGSQRISSVSRKRFLSQPQTRLLPALLRSSPGWGEMTYLNLFEKDSQRFDRRDYLLGWIFAIIEKQYGFALDLSILGAQWFGDPIFSKLERESLMRLRRGYLSLPFFLIKTIWGRMHRLVRG
ncbi:MAG: hypothetical protein Fur0034_16630 [Desulfuromonadia bacterium]